MGGHYQTAGVYTCYLMLPLVCTPHIKKKLKKKYRVNCDKMTSKKEWEKSISFFNSYSRIFICACSVIIEYVNKKQIKYLEQKLTKQSEYATSVYSPLFFRGGGGTIPLVWIWKPIVSRTVEEAMSQCWYLPIVFVLVFITVPVSNHFCVVCRHFICLMLLFQGRVPCQNIIVP